MIENLTGKDLGRYELRERLGSGGMAEVYKGYHTTLARFVAVKILHPFLRGDATFKERFEREAQNVARLRHPNIVQVYDFDQDPDSGLYYMVMEYIDGPPLDSYLLNLEAEGKWIPLSEAIHIVKEIAGALSYAHGQDMVHRDLKPANVMIDSDGRIVLTDFGIARMVTGPQMTASGTMIGTPAYMSPEQGLGQNVDHRSDIYSLGIVLYQLATQALPYMADTPIAIVLQHVNEPLPAPSEFLPDIPHGLERIIFKALAKLPDERYQTIGEMVMHLDNLESAATLAIPQSTISSRAVEASASSVRPDIAEASGRVARRGSGLLFAIGGGFLAILAVVVGFFLLLGNVIPIGQMTAVSPEAIETSVPNTTPTVDQQGTIGALAATSEALASNPETPTPDLTATIIACDYDYNVVELSPDVSASRPDRMPFTQEITVVNNSWCTWGRNTRLVFVEGEKMDALDFMEIDRLLDPGDEYTIEIPFIAPDMAISGVDIESVWQLELADGTQIGPPLVLEFTLYNSDILLTPVATNTPMATSTPEGIDVEPLQVSPYDIGVQNCRRRPEQPIDYVCDVTLTIWGGLPPYGARVEGMSYQWEGPPYTVRLGGRTDPECTSFPWSAIISDSSGQTAHQEFYFNVTQYYGSFVDGACP